MDKRKQKDTLEIKVEIADAATHAVPVLAVPVAEGEGVLPADVAALDQRLEGRISDLLERGDIEGKEGQTLLLYPGASVSAERVVLVGVGKRSAVNVERARRFAATAVRQGARLKADRVAVLSSVGEYPETPIAARDVGRGLAEGAVLGGYVFDQLKTADEDRPRGKVASLTILTGADEDQRAVEEGVRVGRALARGENLARDLGNLPGNVATPTYLGETAERIAREYGMKATILGPRELEKEGLNALVAVSRGSDAEARLIILEHRKGKGGKPLVLLGKGLTFDAGGISIKPSQGMEDMKFDMCGGAAVLGAMQAIGELDVAADVIGVVPSTENLLSGSAVKPGDIIRSHLGKTIEVVNTDAEGRLILADALSYLRKFDPAAVVDAATLTGSCIVALGHHASAAMTNDDGLLQEIRTAAGRSGEAVWPLPMLEEYKEQIRSDYADIKNTGGRPAGTITAAWFLREFVGDFPWVHLDVAGTASGDGKLAYQTKGATGVPTRLFVEWVLSRAS